MISDWEILAAANLVIKRDGEGAKSYAANRADDLLKQGNMTGNWVWLQILEQIEELQRAEPRAAEGLH